MQHLQVKTQMCINTSLKKEGNSFKVPFKKGDLGESDVSHYLTKLHKPLYSQNPEGNTHK